jgi:putative ABC transport system permease protein
VDGVRTAFTGDLAISASQYGDGGLSPQITTDLGHLPQVASTAGVGSGSALVDGDSVTVTVANPPDLTGVVRVKSIAGSVQGMASGQLAVTEKVATDHAWHVGTAIPIRYADGADATLTLGAIYRSNSLLGSYLVPEQTWRQHTSPYLEATVYVALADGVNATQARQAVTAAVAGYGAPDVRDRQQLIDFQTQNITQLLGVVYVMLALAILIALMGIANTLSLAVHERGRELGLLRAVGATRGQIRAMVRWESTITALFGAVVGIALGTFLGWVLVRASDTDGTAVFSAPASSLAIVVVVGALAGVLAGLLPARRAARLPLLPAIAAE